MAVFCFKSGRGITATSPQTISFGYLGVSMTVTWESTALGEGMSPFSLSRIALMYLSVLTNPFIRISPSPALIMATAFSAALTSDGAVTIVTRETSKPFSSQVFRIAPSSPTRTASTRLLSMAL